MDTNIKAIKIETKYGNTCSIKITKGVDPQRKGVMCSDKQALLPNFE